MLVLKKGKVTGFEGVDLPDGGRMNTIEGDAYKYLGILWYVPVVVGAVGMITKNLKQHLKAIGATVKVELLQKQRYLERKDC